MQVAFIAASGTPMPHWLDYAGPDLGGDGGGGGGGGCSCIFLLLRPTPTCPDAGPDLYTLHWCSPSMKDRLDSTMVTIAMETY